MSIKKNTSISKRSLFFFTSVGLLSPTLATAESYTVRPNESLSEIIYKLKIRPVYGSNGGIKQAIESNPELQKHQGNRIYPGQVLQLSGADSSQDTAAAPSPDETTGPAVTTEAPVTEAPVTEVPVTEAPYESAVETTPEAAPEESFGQTSDAPVEGSSATALDTLSVGLGLDFFKVEGEDRQTFGDAAILSEASPSLHLKYDLRFSKVSSVLFATQLQQFQLQKLNAGQELNNDSGTRINFNVRYLRKITEKLTLGAGSAFDQDLFFYAKSPTVLAVDKVYIIKPEVYAAYDLLKFETSTLGIDGRVGYNFSEKTDNYDIKSGSHGELGAYYFMNKKIIDADFRFLEAHVNYGKDYQDTTISSREAQNLSFLIQYNLQMPW